MLNDLDALSQYVDRIIDENDRHQSQVIYLTKKLDDLNREQNILQTELIALKNQNNTLLYEQSVLVDKIEAAQSALNVILNGLSDVALFQEVADGVNQTTDNAIDSSEYIDPSIKTNSLDADH